MKQKKLWSVLLALVLIVSILPPAYAAGSEAVDAANKLYELGLFTGTGTDASGKPIFELDRVPTRNEAVTMLVRLLGKEAEAKSKTWSIPFTDVPDWARPYVGYAYTNGLTNGMTSTIFGGGETVTPSQYLTFALRALDYQSGTDFQWDRAWELSDKIGLTAGQYNAGTKNFTRGDVAIISYNVLWYHIKGTYTILMDRVKENLSQEVKPDVGEHTHNWATRHVDEVGHTESNGTHKVLFKRCDCGFEVNSDMPNMDNIWEEHIFRCGRFSIFWYKDVPNDPQYIVDTPAHDEVYCTICGQQKSEVTAHTHNWATRHVAEVGHTESSGTHEVLFKKCDCGFIVNSDMSNMTDIWRNHIFRCEKRSIFWYEDVPNDPQYIVDTPAHDETYCTICGAVQ